MKLFQCLTLFLLIVLLAACDQDPQVNDTSVETSQVSSSTMPALSTDERWWSPGDGRLFDEIVNYANDTGVLSTYNQSGPFKTEDHPFFKAIGSNGRACVTCHQPADGMSLSARTAQQRWDETNGKDPLFAAVDGSNCPDLPQKKRDSHSLLLDYGLIRVGRPWPPEPYLNSSITPQFTIEIIRDPASCNTSKEYGMNSKSPTISVYRRPRPAANLKFVTAVGFPFEPKDGLPLPRHPESGQPMSGNIMADRRVWTLEDQAIDALKGHLEYEGEPPRNLVEEIVKFESQVFIAQSYDFKAGSLTTDGAQGGPEFLAQADAGVLNSGTRLPMWDEFESWIDLIENSDNEKYAHLSQEQIGFRQSIARGVKLFRDRTFLVNDNAGITDMGFGNPVRNDCNFCHNMTRSGMDVAPGQVDLGTTNEPFAKPLPHLPLFKLTCKEGFAPHAHLGREVYTSDPGLALTTGRCKDIGKITIQNMRGMVARAPFFANGSVKNIRELVDYYEERYRINLTDQDKQDLINLMSVL